MSDWKKILGVTFVLLAGSSAGNSRMLRCAVAQTIVAHRGASHDAPENTLAAFRLAWQQGADAIEGDFYLTADKQIVCIHDKTTERTAGTKLKVADSTLQQLRELEYGAWKSEQFRGEPIPTLDQVLATVPPGRQVFVEVKCGAEIVPLMKDVFARSSLAPTQIVVISFKEDVIDATKTQIPEVSAYWLTGYEQDEQSGMWSPELPEILDTLKRIRADGLDTKAEMNVLNEDFVQRLRREGHAVHTWTVDDPQVAVDLQRLGVDSITTNRPQLIRQALQAGPAVAPATSDDESVEPIRRSGQRRWFRRFLKRRRS